MDTALELQGYRSRQFTSALQGISCLWLPSPSTEFGRRRQKSLTTYFDDDEASVYPILAVLHPQLLHINTGPKICMGHAHLRQPDLPGQAEAVHLNGNTRRCNFWLRLWKCKFHCWHKLV
ncbi:unnamed protein product [Urochloa humidicola]